MSFIPEDSTKICFTNILLGDLIKAQHDQGPS